MKKKLFLIVAAALFVTCFLVASVSAEDTVDILLENGSYYLHSQAGGGSPYLLYNSVSDYESDMIDSSLDDFITILYGEDFEKFVEDMQERYNNNINGVQEQFDSFEDYFVSGFGYTSERFLNSVKKQVEMVLKAKVAEDSEQGGSGDTGSGGGNEGNDGSSSSGSQNGEPNVTIDPTVDTSHWENCYCGSAIQNEQCQCYKKGYSDGWSYAIISEAVKNALQQAFDQGFREVNTESWHDTLVNEVEEALKQFKKSDEYKNEIDQAKKTAVKEYRQSEQYVEDFTSEDNSQEEQSKIEEIKNKIIEDFKNSPEQMEIIGQAKEDAKAEFVVEIDSVLKGDRQPATDYEEGMKVLVEEKIQYEREDAVNDFASELEDIMSGESEPVEGSPGENVVQSFMQNISLAFQEGKAEGEANFKLSLEYRTALETEYEAGADAGYQQGFMIGTNDGYSKGLLDGAELANEELYNKGKNEYMNTEAYQKTLQDTYDEGYEDGSDNSSNPFIYMVPALVLCGLVIGYVAISSRIKKKKKK